VRQVSKIRSVDLWRPQLGIGGVYNIQYINGKLLKMWKRSEGGSITCRAKNYITGSGPPGDVSLGHSGGYF